MPDFSGYPVSRPLRRRGFVVLIFPNLKPSLAVQRVPCGHGAVGFQLFGEGTAQTCLTKFPCFAGYCEGFDWGSLVLGLELKDSRCIVGPQSKPYSRKVI